jgi:hypothetical protein
VDVAEQFPEECRYVLESLAVVYRNDADVFMSLIHTCELCGVNAFDYLTELERHADELSSQPQDWLPWNYRKKSKGQGT